MDNLRQSMVTVSSVVIMVSKSDVFLQMNTLYTLLSLIYPHRIARLALRQFCTLQVNGGNKLSFFFWMFAIMGDETMG